VKLCLENMVMKVALAVHKKLQMLSEQSVLVTLCNYEIVNCMLTVR